MQNDALLPQAVIGSDNLKNEVSLKNFMEWIINFNGLLWSLEIKKSRLNLLNAWEHPLLGKETALLLKDIHYRHRVLHPDDNLLLAEFWDIVALGEPVSVIFRVMNPTNAGFTLFILKGWSAKNEASHIYGSLQELPASAAFNDSGTYPYSVLAHTDYPVIEVDLKSKKAFIENPSAHILFDIQHNQDAPHFRTDIQLQNVVPDAKMSEQCFKLTHTSCNNQIEKANVWIGKRIFQNINGKPFHAIVRMTALARTGHYRIAFIRIFTENVLQLNQNNSDLLMKKINKSKDLKQSLSLLLDSNILPQDIDGLIFSNIRSRKDHVTVYGVGKCFEKLTWGVNYTYKGTIAQDIERFMLSNLVVDDTQDSIKSIDWVLFAPFGIRSYFAKPFYNRKKLHAVLIFCSKTPLVFSQSTHVNIDKNCTPLFSAFEHIIKKWRKKELI